MTLEEFKILNYRSCRSISLKIGKDVPTILIGLNDSGKSTFLRAVECFFSEKACPVFALGDTKKTDLSNSPLSAVEFAKFFEDYSFPVPDFYDEKSIIFVAQLIIEDCDISQEFLDDAKKNILKWAMESVGHLVLLKKTSNISTEYYILTHDVEYAGKSVSAWDMGSKELQALRASLGLTESDIENENGVGRFANLELIRAIYKKLDSTKKVVWAKYETFGKDREFFPSVQYIDWNFNFKDLSDQAGEAMASVIKPYIEDIQQYRDGKMQALNDEVNKTFGDMVREMRDELPPEIKSIATNVAIDIKQRITDLMLEKDGRDGEVHIENQGDGIKRQIWLAILKWKARHTHVTNGKRHIWCFDEPETHLYPAAQRSFFSIISTLSGQDFQAILGTHSTIFVDKARLNNVHRFAINNSYSEVLSTDLAEDVFDALGVKNSDFLFHDTFLLVEGPTEIGLIPRLYTLKYGHTIIDANICLIPLGGKDRRKNYREMIRDIFSNFKKDIKSVILLDRDSGSADPDVTLIGTCDLEDSISNQVWLNVLSTECGISCITEADLNDIRRQLDPHDKRKKFMPLLSSLICSRGSVFSLDKGEDLGIALARHMQVSDIPTDIDLLFKKLEAAL